MNSEVHNDTAPDSGGGVSAFETMVTEYREGQEKTRANNRSAPTIELLTNWISMLSPNTNINLEP
jgi:hypothetical protein